MKITYMSGWIAHCLSMCEYGAIYIEFGVKGEKVAVGKLISGSPLHNKS